MEIRWINIDTSRPIQSNETISPNETHSRFITFTNLLESDSGEYTCETILAPQDNSSSLNTRTIYILTAIGKPLFLLLSAHSVLWALCIHLFIVSSLTVETSPSIVRILDVPPYNQFTLSCTVWAEAQGERVPLPLTIDWIKRVESGSNVRFTPLVSEEPHLSPDPADGYHSILRGSETSSAGSTRYRCRASFVTDGTTHNKTHDSLVAVVGK